MTAVGPVDKLRFLVSIAADRRLNATDLRCGIVIADLHNAKKGRAWPSYPYLVNSTGSCRASIARSVKKLHLLGIIIKVRGGRGRANSYHPAFAKSALPRSEIASGDYPGDPGIGLKIGDSVSSVTPIQSHPRYKTSLTNETPSYTHPAEQPAKQGVCGRSSPSGGAAPSGARPAGPLPSGGSSDFNKWFAAYPKHEGRLAASSAYAAALLGGDVSVGLLLASAEAYAAAKRHLDPQYIKMPANWLREQCWLEDPQPPKAKAWLGRRKQHSAAKAIK